MVLFTLIIKPRYMFPKLDYRYLTLLKSPTVVSQILNRFLRVDMALGKDVFFIIILGCVVSRCLTTVPLDARKIDYEKGILKNSSIIIITIRIVLDISLNKILETFKI